jgi:Lon-like protease
MLVTVYRPTWTLMAACLLALALGVLGATLPVPMVALGPGPTYDTLGLVDDKPVVTVDGVPVYPTSGHLNMTTVSVTDHMTLFSAIGEWASPSSQVVPRDQVFPSSRTTEEIRQQNAEQFASSESNAESAALAELGLPATVVVTNVEADTPAAPLLRPGDELIAVAGTPVDSVRAVTDLLAAVPPGAPVGITYRRDGQTLHSDVVLAARPDLPHGVLGVYLAGMIRDGDIKFELGGIGGPSAGLMFALSVVDKMTPGALADGRFVAGTGAILPNGVVTKIDGIAHKIRAAREAGATVFMVPSENCDDATSAAPDGLTLVRVGTLHDAISALEALANGLPIATC